MTRIAILGAGYGGVHAAKVLHKKLKGRDVEVTLYDKNSFHTLRTELHEVAGGRCEPDSVRVSLEKIFGGKSINVVVDRIQTVDFEARTLKSEFADYSWDYLVLGVGAEPEFFGIPGVEQNSFTLWTYDDALRLREHIEAQFLKASREPNPERRKTILRLVVAGAGFTGIELLGELLEWKEALCREYLIDPEEVTIMNVEAMTDILPTLSKELRTKAVRYIEDSGAELKLNTAITEVTPEGFRVKSGEFFATETLIWTCGVRGCAFAGNLTFPHAPHLAVPPLDQAEHDLRFNIKKKARLQTNTYLQSVDDEKVYVVGDVLWFHDKNRALPQVVETALQSGDLVAKNIVADLDNQPKAEFHPKYHGFLVSIGSRFAVADVMGVKFSGFWAMTMKHLVNLHYLWEVAGFNACWGYLVHHFLQIKSNRSTLGSHAAAKTSSFWLLPLRLFLGATWFSVGLAGILHKGWANIMPVSPLMAWSEAGVGLALLLGLFTVLAADVSIVLSLILMASGLLHGGSQWLFIFAALTMQGGGGKVLGLDYVVMPALKKWWNRTRWAKKSYLYVDEPRKANKKNENK